MWEFAKDAIVIGRRQTCDMVLNQPTLSSFQAKVYRLSEDEYVLKDVNAHNGTFTTPMNQQSEPGHNKIIRATDNVVVSNIICSSFFDACNFARCFKFFIFSFHAGNSLTMRKPIFHGILISNQTTRL